ncbi:MAG: hypothetical protein OEV40_26970 [Acidimicrobiia bacterium]|nr:hypothetical protein [Acidimicrobiia bacterium]
MPEFEVELDRVATGGAALGPGPDGRVVFVSGALPGERVIASVVADHATRIEARVLDVLDPSPGRQGPPCRHVGDGCGGCDWQHATAELQRDLRRSIVIDCLTRLARIREPDVRLGPALDPERYRTTVRVALRDGRPGYRAGRSHAIVPVESCVVAHPLIEELLVDGRFGSAAEVSLRVGARTGERVVVARPTAEGVAMPGDVIVVGDDELRRGREVHYHEEIAEHRLRISAQSFFQCRPDGAEALVALVGEAIADAPGLLVDAYCGVGLFGAILAGRSPEPRPMTGIEANPAAAADAANNYHASATISRRKMERWSPSPAGAVIADPARVGLGKVVAAKLAQTDAAVIALVSCDPASLARDAMLLASHGYDLDHVTVVDLFGHTSHVETVSRFVRRGWA